VLSKAYQINSKDAETVFYYGMNLEFLQKRNNALQVYAQYPNVSNLSPFRSKIEGRYHWLTRIKIQEEIKALLKQEAQLESRLSAKKIAVFPFSIEKDNSKFATLGKGLSEMIITDLSQIKKIQLIERLRIEALLKEMSLSYTGLVEQKSAARFGKLLSAGKIIHGKVTVLPKNILRLDASYWDIINKQFPQFSSESDALDYLFKMEKDIVFKIIDEMGIELTQEERKRIQYIPTKNMQAFIAYCMGLDLQDGGNYKAAAAQFEKAAGLDPNFSLANNNAATAENMDLAAGSIEHFAASIIPIEKLQLNNLVTDRLHSLNINIGSNFIPGKDNRKPDRNTGLSKLPGAPNPPK